MAACLAILLPSRHEIVTDATDKVAANNVVWTPLSDKPRLCSWENDSKISLPSPSDLVLVTRHKKRDYHAQAIR
jgi:hypothetical protein